MLNRKRNASPARLAYGVRELATMAGISKGRMERLLTTNAVEFSRSGNRRLVFASSLERSMPDLVDSIRGHGNDDE